jgi:hypothetical protein
MGLRLKVWFGKKKIKCLDLKECSTIVDFVIQLWVVLTI